jgi:hypothetical protein
VLTAQRPEEQPVCHDAQPRNQDCRQHGCDEVVQTEQFAGVVGRKRTQHVELAVREIDDAQHAEHERQPRRDEHVAHASDESVDDLLGEKGQIHHQVLGRVRVTRTRPIWPVWIMSPT